VLERCDDVATAGELAAEVRVVCAARGHAVREDDDGVLVELPVAFMYSVVLSLSCLVLHVFLLMPPPTVILVLLLLLVPL